ncbi:hypothetical protein NPIL_309171 [Nephila pilipes]|uniref:Uncharacterized protein n=1 Tax=Nephila pilipes TaxID=299642 RepID=A0A8X6R4I2_NEPPI|nr:hypothetical protein NPIL_309171 [Nephila pilipes]
MILNSHSFFKKFADLRTALLDTAVGVRPFFVARASAVKLCHCNLQSCVSDAYLLDLQWNIQLPHRNARNSLALSTSSPASEAYIRYSRYNGRLGVPYLSRSL